MKATRPTVRKTTDSRAILYGYSPRPGTRRPSPYGRQQ